MRWHGTDNVEGGKYFSDSYELRQIWRLRLDPREECNFCNGFALFLKICMQHIKIEQYDIKVLQLNNHKPNTVLNILFYGTCEYGRYTCFIQIETVFTIPDPTHPLKHHAFIASVGGMYLTMTRQNFCQLITSIPALLSIPVSCSRSARSCCTLLLFAKRQNLTEG